MAVGAWYATTAEWREYAKHARWSAGHEGGYMLAFLIGVPRERQKARASKMFAHTYVRMLCRNHTVMHICIHACLCVYAQGSWRNQLAQASRARTRAGNARKQARAKDWRKELAEFKSLSVKSSRVLRI